MSNIKIIYVDDEEVILDNVKEYFSGYDITFFSDSEAALRELKSSGCDIVLSDYKMPKLTGLDLLMESKKIGAYKYGILLTAFADKSLLEEMVNQDLVNKIIEKPFKLKELKVVLDNAITFCQEEKEKDTEIEQIKSSYETLKKELESDTVIGFNRGLKSVYSKVEAVSKHPVNVLLSGETGTGKELIARTVHNLSPRKDGPFIKINSTAIPETLFESELFGFKKGAFSNATHDKAGKIELAHNGTLFLDEIGDMDLGLQAKLLRVLQEKEVERLGSNKTIKVDFRLIVASNRNLEEMIEQKLFREDLFYRMNEYPIHLPPLRERLADLEELLVFFLRKSCEELNIKNRKMATDTVEELKKYNWPGNIRELKNAVKRVVIAYSDQEIIKPEYFEFLFNKVTQKVSKLEEAISVFKDKIIEKKLELKNVEELILKAILDDFNENVAEAVENTGISKNRFYKVK